MANLEPPAADQGASSRSYATSHDDVDNASSFDDAIRDILPENIPNTIYTRSPEERFRLGTWSVIGLVINRVIGGWNIREWRQYVRLILRIVGSGIFNSPSTVMRGTQSVGTSLLFWVAGAIYGITGAYLYIEFGLTIPRHEINGVDTAVPRSGGTLNYLQYAFRWPAYRPGTVLLVTCIFAITFVLLGNMAGNCLVFGIRVLMAANVPVTNGSVRGIAISVATAACFIHAFSRRGGIWLGNFIAVIKVLILLMIIITAICALAGAFHSTTYADENMAIQHSFANASQDSYGYAQAFLAVLFASAGFEQPNYVSYQSLLNI